MRLLGAVLVIGSLGALGLLRAAALGRREQELEELDRALVWLRGEVTHRRLPAAPAFRAAARACGGLVRESLQAAAELLERGQAAVAGEAWWQAYGAVEARSFLQPHDRAALADFCRQFGQVDSATQQAAFDAVLERVREGQRQAALERERYERLLRFSGVAMGLGLVILLL